MFLIRDILFFICLCVPPDDEPHLEEGYHQKMAKMTDHQKMAKMTEMTQNVIKTSKIVF